MLSLAGAVGLLRAPSSLAAEGTPETPTLPLAETAPWAWICVAPVKNRSVALRAEGFTDIRYVPVGSGDQTEAVGGGRLDFALNDASSLTAAIDSGVPITALAGIQQAASDSFGHEGIRGIADLKGKSVAVRAMAAADPPYLFVALMAAEVGIDPHKDIHWVMAPEGKTMDLFVDGKVDAFLASSSAARATLLVRSDTSSSTVRSHRPGLNISVVCSTVIWTMFKKPGGDQTRIARRPQVYRFLRQPARNASLDNWSTTVPRRATTASSRSSASCLTTDGGNTTPKTRSVLCAASARGRSDQLNSATKLSPTAPTGAFSTK